MAALSKAWICSHSLAGIVGSNPTGGMGVCLLWVLCIVRKRSLRRADHSSGGVLPTVVRGCVWSRNLVNEEALARVGPQRHRKKKVSKTTFHFIEALRSLVLYLFLLTLSSWAYYQTLEPLYIPKRYDCRWRTPLLIVAVVFMFRLTTLSITRSSSRRMLGLLFNWRTGKLRQRLLKEKSGGQCLIAD